MAELPPIIHPRSGHNDWLTSQELNALTPALLAARVDAIQSFIAEHAGETERLRRPADAVMEALRKTGIFYHFVPKRYGGFEYGLVDLVNEVLPIGEACTSTAWVTSFCIQHNFLAAQLPIVGQDEIFGATPYTIAPGTGAPPAKVTQVEGGYRVSGLIKYASGIMHADWVQVVGALVSDSDKPRMRFFMLPANEVKVLDTWYVDGLAGTGSNDILLENIFIPERRSVDFDDLLAGRGFGAREYVNPLYRVPVDILLNISSSAPGIGAARGIVKHFRDLVIKKAVPGPDGRPIPKLTWQMRLAEAELASHTAEMLLRQAASDTEAAVVNSQVVSAESRIRIRSRIAYAVDLARRAVRIISDGAGSSAHLLSSPIQRVMRDMNMLTSHRVYEKDSALELWGQVLTDSASAGSVRHHSAQQVRPPQTDAAAAGTSGAIAEAAVARQSPV